MQIFTYSCLEALNIGSQNRVSNVRRPFNPSQHCSVVCHLKNQKTNQQEFTLKLYPKGVCANAVFAEEYQIQWFCLDRKATQYQPTCSRG